MRQYIIGLIAILLCASGNAQIDSDFLKKNITAGEDSVIAIFGRRDWNAYVNYMNPVVVDMLGGKDGFVAYMKDQMKVLDKAELQVYRTGKIMQLLKMGEQYQCIVETYMQMRLNGSTVTGISYDIGISGDGKSWSFFRITENASRAQIKTICPDLSPDLKLPRSQMGLNKTIEEFMATYEVHYLE